MLMKTPKATIRAGGTTETRTEETPKLAKEAGPKPETGSFTDQTHRSITVTPMLSEMLAKVEGIARWGLNE